jgi:hypothetical protein
MQLLQSPWFLQLLGQQGGGNALADRNRFTQANSIAALAPAAALTSQQPSIG